MKLVLAVVKKKDSKIGIISAEVVQVSVQL